MDYLVAIECKANINKHESSGKNNPKNYAVDGLLHYSNFLSKEFDVITIAVICFL